MAWVVPLPAYSYHKKEYSNDDATKNNGGQMGTFNALKLDDVTRQAYAKLKVGESMFQEIFL